MTVSRYRARSLSTSILVSALLCQTPAWTEESAKSPIQRSASDATRIELLPGPLDFSEAPAEISLSIRQEMLLQSMPAQRAIEVLKWRFPNLNYTLHPTLNGFYVTGTKRDILELKSAVGPLDELYGPGKIVRLRKPNRPLGEQAQNWPVPISLQHLSPTRVAQFLDSLYPDCSFTPDENRQEILVAAPDPSLDAIREILKILDTVQEPVRSREDSLEPSSVQPKNTIALSGEFGEIDSLLKSGQLELALQRANQWHSQNPGDALALIALGHCYKANGQPQQAALAYSSLIDPYPGRADLSSFAGCLLGTVWQHQQSSLECASKALILRPDQPTGHLLKAYAQIRVGRLEDALQTLEKAYKTDFPKHRSDDVRKIIGGDLRMVAAALIAQEPSQKSRLVAKLKSLKLALPNGPSVRCVLTWEADNDRMEFRIGDAQNVEIDRWTKGRPDLQFYENGSNGYGPECVVLKGTASYNLSVHESWRGQADYVMGNVAILRYDGSGVLGIEHRPFVMMSDYATVNLGMLP